MDFGNMTSNEVKAYLENFNDGDIDFESDSHSITDEILKVEPNFYNNYVVRYNFTGKTFVEKESELYKDW